MKTETLRGVYFVHPVIVPHLLSFFKKVIKESKTIVSELKNSKPTKFPNYHPADGVIRSEPFGMQMQLALEKLEPPIVNTMRNDKHKIKSFQLSVEAFEPLQAKLQ